MAGMILVAVSGTAHAQRFLAFSYGVKEGRMAELFAGPPPRLPGEFEPPPALCDRAGYWKGVKDERLFSRVRESKVVKVTLNKGGSSVSLRVHFADGSSAAFKPDQIHYQSMPRKEIVAYRVNRMLGLSRVPPATVRVFTKKEIFGNLEGSGWLKRKLSEEINTRKDGSIPGELSWWIPKITFLPLGKWEHRKRWYQWLKAYKRMPKKNYKMAAQLSVMLLFDFLIDNMDRFSGRNVCADSRGEHLYFMDNTLSFFPRNPHGSKATHTGLYRVQRFSRSFYKKLKALTGKKLRKELAKEKKPPWNLLEESEFKMFMRRRAYALRYMHRMIANYGWEKTMVFP